VEKKDSKILGGEGKMFWLNCQGWGITQQFLNFGVKSKDCRRLIVIHSKKLAMQTAIKFHMKSGVF